MTALAILQARMSSTRLPGKVLRPILGQPMLLRQIERIHRAKRIDRLVVATSDRPDDDPIEAVLHGTGVECVRGPLMDVLGRFALAIAGRPGDLIVRLTADCPLTDWTVIDAIVDAAQNSGSDYTSNTLHRGFPDGLDVEVVRRRALEEAVEEATEPYDREHVTAFLYHNPERFSCRNVEATKDLHDLRWTVDTQEDLDFVVEVYKALYPANNSFDTQDILALLGRRPELVELNQTDAARTARGNPH